MKTFSGIFNNWCGTSGEEEDSSPAGDSEKEVDESRLWAFNQSLITEQEKFNYCCTAYKVPTIFSEIQPLGVQIEGIEERDFRRESKSSAKLIPKELAKMTKFLKF